MDRSRSRGREPMISTGRGGAGNARSLSQTGLGESSPKAPVERGRHVDQPSLNKATHSGRGGAGNVRSPSRDAGDRARSIEEDALEAELIRERRAADAGRIRSSGRGGQGNFVGGDMQERSRSRTREDATAYRAGGGRGGAGGWGGPALEEGREDLKRLDEEDERVRQSHAQSRIGGFASSGKGGAGNMYPVTSNQTLVEPRAETTQQSGRSGRGGAGNFHPTPAPPQDERGRGGAPPPEHVGGGGMVAGLKNLVRDFSRSKSRDRKQ